jgi:hypothetical protein
MCVGAELANPTSPAVECNKAFLEANVFEKVAPK